MLEKRRRIDPRPGIVWVCVGGGGGVKKLLYDAWSASLSTDENHYEIKRDSRSARETVALAEKFTQESCALFIYDQ